MPDTGLLRRSWTRFRDAHGPRHVVDAAAPLVAYAVGVVVLGTTLAAVACVGAALLTAVARRRGGDSPRTVALATVAVVACAGLAATTGNATAFFAPGVALNAVGAVVLAASLLIGRPATGYVSQHLRIDVRGWRQDPARHAAHRLMTALWAGLLVVRLAVLVPLYVRHEVVLLAVADAVFLKPSVLFGLILSVVWLRRGRQPVDTR